MRFSFSAIPSVLLSLAIASAIEPEPAPAPTDRYVVTYPAANRFCVPVATYADDVTNTLRNMNYGGQTRIMPNGGYGLPVVMQAQGQNLLHLGADVAWLRPGEPVYSIAAGVVRTSQAPAANPKRGKVNPKSPPARLVASEWGNLIFIEHRLPDGTFLTSIYGHLSNKRLVKAGDIVQAGQRIGTVGKPLENGGYKSHLHFALRSGALAEPGCTLLTLQVKGQPAPLKVVALTESEIEVASESPLPNRMTLHLNGVPFELSSRDEKHYLPTAMLHNFQRPDFTIVGYGLTTDGWRDPTAFLREVNAGAPGG